MKYKNIFLDFDDTLYDTHGNACLALRDVYEHFHLDRHFASLEAFTVPYWQTNEELWARYAAGEIDRPFLILERFRRPLSLCTGLDVTPEYCLQVSDYFLDRCCEQTGIIDGAHELLRYLRSKGYRLFMASNGFHEVQYRKLAAVGMRNYFDAIILSEDAGHNKPSPEYFEYALRISKSTADSTLMIGDNLTSDIMGAAGIGIDQVWFNPAGRPSPDFRPTHIISSLTEVMNII